MLGKIALPAIYFVMLLETGIPLALCVMPALFLWEHSAVLTALYFIFFAIPMYITVIITTAGVLSMPFQKAIVSGVFPRDLNTPLYFGRRVYGACLSTIMGSPIYNLILSFSLSKKIMFKLFGFEGPHFNFTAYTDTWIRDIKLLSLGKNAYLANQATLGTNICLTDGNIMVGRIKIGDDTQLGRLCILGPGSRLGDNCDTGVRTVVGIRSVLKNRVSVGGCTVVSHGVILHDDVSVKEHSYIGAKCEIHAGVKVPVGCNITAGTIILNQVDLDSFFQRQKEDLSKTFDSRSNLFNTGSFEGSSET